MFRLSLVARVSLSLFISGIASTLAAAELPTVEQILEIHRANNERLTNLHLRLVHHEETTPVYVRRMQKETEELKKIVQMETLATDTENANVQVDGKTLKGEEAQKMIASVISDAKRRLKQRPAEQKTFQLITPMEFFFSGENYQFRQSLNSMRDPAELDKWTYFEEPITPENLLTTYRNVGIFSRSADMNPPGRWWHHSTDWYAYITEKHLNGLMLVKLPPLTGRIQPRWDMRHSYDGFFLGQAKNYRVLRQEDVDGRLLTVVEARIEEPDSHGMMLLYRAWLDLSRGALPTKIWHYRGDATLPEDLFDRWHAFEISTTKETKELPSGAFYPTVTVMETYINDPDAPELTTEQWAEVRAGKRKAPMVVDRRHTWTCSLVENKTSYDKDFFVVRFPEGQMVYDHDAGKTIGALEKQPLVKVGQEAPPLTIANWLDGKQRTLADLKGQVVVLDFWALSCGACRNSVPDLTKLQEHYRDKPVTFISIHIAERDPVALTAKITQFKKDSNWTYLGAIDAGNMSENSVTSRAYGVPTSPFTVIIGPDGKIIYADPHIEDAPTCDEENPEILAAFQQKFEELLKSRFEAVGEPWPREEEREQKEFLDIYRRVECKFMQQQIEAALKSARE